jgi:phage portal protein BeeE
MRVDVDRFGGSELWHGLVNAGGVPPGTFKNSSESVDQDAAELIKARLGRAIASRQPLVYGMEWDFNPIAIPPEQAQFVQTQNLTANQIAAIYGIAPEEVGGVPTNSLTYNTEELRQTRQIADLRPWFVRFESGLQRSCQNVSLFSLRLMRRSCRY